MILEDVRRIWIRLEEIENRRVEKLEKDRIWVEKKSKMNLYEIMIY